MKALYTFLLFPSLLTCQDKAPVPPKPNSAVTTPAGGDHVVSINFDCEEGYDLGYYKVPVTSLAKPGSDLKKSPEPTRKTVTVDKIEFTLVPVEDRHEERHYGCVRREQTSQ